jgi:hypothetical protein
MDHRALDGLSLWLTARFGLHTRVGRRVFYLPIAHRPWPLYRGAATAFDDALVCAVGLTVHGPPDSVLYSPVFGRSSDSPCWFGADLRTLTGIGVRKQRKGPRVAAAASKRRSHGQHRS